MMAIFPLPQQDAGDISRLRRGACPSLAEPMATGDGLLVRLRPAALSLSPPDLAQIARMAARHGNGLVEITARGNLQLRGLRPETVPALAIALEDAGIALSTGLAIEVPPLTGIDPGELADPLPFVAGLRAALADCKPALVLAPKLAVILDGGGRFHLGDQSADIRARAVVHQGDVFWEISVGGTERSATRLAAIAGDDLVAALMTVLSALHDLGPGARGRDLDGAAVRHRLCELARLDVPPCPARTSSPAAIGLHDLGPGKTVLGMRLAFGQIDSRTLAAFAAVLDGYPGAGIRLAPDHGLLVTGIVAGDLAMLRGVAVQSGFHVAANDRALQIAACSGRGACASGLIDTRASARCLMDAAPALLDGSVSVHLSGCVKGCARPAPAVLTLTGTPSGVALAVNGAASGHPIVHFEEKALGSALRALQQLVADEKHAGESVRSCLTRLGTEAIATAVQQG